MSMIVNLTQHLVTGEQLAAGVVDLPADQRAILTKALTFESLPTRGEIVAAVEVVAGLAASAGPALHILPDAAMIGGAMWLMAPLAAAIESRGIEALFAFSQRESVEEPQADGSIRKTAIFRHVGFVPAIV